MALALVEPHLTLSEVDERYRRAIDGVEKIRWLALLKRLEGEGTSAIAKAVNHRPDWVRRLIRAYNTRGPAAMLNGRSRRGRKPLLDHEQLQALRQAVENEKPPGGGLWNGPKAATWLSKLLGRRVPNKRGWVYLRKLGLTLKVPRTHHAKGDPEAQEAFKKGGLPST